MSIPFTQLNKLYIDGAWVSANGPTEAVLNPATEEVIGQAPVGDTASADAAPGTIRAEFAESVGENSVHGSDAPETAQVEIAYFFSGLELVG